MKIQAVINRVKLYYKGGIDDSTTRDKILFGNPDKECTGIAITLWASMEVIQKAADAGANLLICHEALFWNHGDHTDWLQEQKNQAFLKKKQLLESSGIVVWRNHDYIHSGIPVNNQYCDGIFYGFAKKMNWESYIVGTCGIPTIFEIPEVDIPILAKQMMQKLQLNGLRLIGNRNTKVRKVCLCLHIWGDAEDNQIIHATDHENYDVLLPGELVDFTVAEYIKDCGLQGMNKAMLIPGHFNIEEPGMEYMLQYVEKAIGTPISCIYIPSKDMYEYFKQIE